jgi:WD40 repeat protein
VPPLPDAVPPLPGDATANNAAGNNQGEIAPPGQFVANDEIDEGVKLLCKFKHGSTGPEVVGPGTRSKRATVNVICVARCPLGFYFATGSDDGICRVFDDEEEFGVAIVDQRSGNEKSASFPVLNRRTSHTSNEPVLTLKGHVSAITDLSYSSAGDRILSASQKDGVVRIWAFGRPILDKKSEGGVSQIVIKLIDPNSLALRSQPQASRRSHGGSNRTDSSTVSCDVAVWTHDDAKVITSQSVLVKQSGSDIQPGSQYVFLWDSRSGQCLLGISGAHTMQCPVVVPHPMDSSLVCTAGADGFARLWDWQSGKCIFSHTNKVEFGPVEQHERGKTAGYLDGTFNADGTTLVLTDDSGRLTIFDGNAKDDEITKRNSTSWMHEQYFANDYYDLVYDRSGYCIEKGSERPPHLAPRGVRCDHSGAPWSDDVNEAFSKIVGPSPLPEQFCRWQRGDIRGRALSAWEKAYEASETRAVKASRGVREFDPSTTILIKGPGAKDIEDKPSPRRSVEDLRTATVQRSGRNESENWRYLDYDDMIRLQGNQDEDEPDSDDEEFSPTVRNRGPSHHSDDSENDELDLEELETEAVSQPTGNRAVQNTAREQRSRRRAQPRDMQFLHPGSEDEMDDQIMSTNNTPSGKFVSDYIEKGHFWRMPSSNVRGMWLKRLESDTSYEGRKIYAPQLGDSVVYIPRAHYETLKTFPSLEPPWQHWPQGTAWPVVRCSVRGVRFRFPYQDYYRSSK